MHKYLNAKVNRSENLRAGVNNHHTIEAKRANTRLQDEDMVIMGDVKRGGAKRGGTKCEDGEAFLQTKKPRYPLTMNTLQPPTTKSKLTKKERKRVIGNKSLTLLEQAASDPNTVA